MLPGELIRYMDGLVARTLHRTRQGNTNNGQGSPSGGAFRQLYGGARWANSQN